MAFSNVPSKVEDNLRARKDSIVGAGRREVGIVKGAVNREISIGKNAVQNLLQIKPVPAVIDAVVDTIDNVAGVVTGSIDNVGDAVKDQGRITREWLPDVDLRSPISRRR